MRTTLTLDDDLAGILQSRSRQLGRSFKHVVNSTLRKGLQDDLPVVPDVQVRPHDFGVRPGLDLDRMNQINDALEVETFQEKEGRE